MNEDRQLLGPLSVSILKDRAPVTVPAPVGRAIPDEYAGRAMEEAMRSDIVFGLSGGNLKRLLYSESLFPEWSAEKRKQLRFELLGDGEA